MKFVTTPRFLRNNKTSAAAFEAKATSVASSWPPALGFRLFLSDDGARKELVADGGKVRDDNPHKCAEVHENTFEKMSKDFAETNTDGL